MNNLPPNNPFANTRNEEKKRMANNALKELRTRMNKGQQEANAAAKAAANAAKAAANAARAVTVNANAMKKKEEEVMKVMQGGKRRKHRTHRKRKHSTHRKRKHTRRH
jgi:hypothetical protein